MTATTPTKRDDRVTGLAFLGAMAALMWLVEIVDAVAFDLDRQGIAPRQLEGLDGILFAPFLHGGWGHLIGNTVPFLALGAVIALSGIVRVGAVTGIVALVGGIGTWLVAPENTVHIGASGIVFGFATYLLSRGVFSRRALHLGVGLIVLLVYGTTLLFGVIPEPGVSWQGHLFGAVGGVVAARLLDARRDRGRALPAPA